MVQTFSETNFLVLMPEDAVKTPLTKIIRHLENHFGNSVQDAFNPQNNIPSCIKNFSETSWLRSAKCVGINVRTIRNFWNIVPYALTLPKAQNAIHILPIWEPGVVASLYGMASWNVNPEFFSDDLFFHFPHLNTVEKQLKIVVNVLHMMGKVIGMDVVPHTDRYSEMALANPQHFEWLLRDGLKIKDNSAHLHEKVQQMILEFLRYRGSASPGSAFPTSREVFFGDDFPEETRLEIMFGKKNDYTGRLKHRKELVNLFYHSGLETVPATMGPPYRGLEVDPSVEAKTVDEDGRVWHDYRITKPQSFSRVFGPLARYKLYESKNNNQDWELDFSAPRKSTFEYVCRNYQKIQSEFQFDFMRGDMSHVQMRPDGVPKNAKSDPFYDLLAAVKQKISADQPAFGYFAESFLAPPGEMAFGDETEHLEASLADSTLGDLQSEPVGTQFFMQNFWQYREWLEHRDFAPNFAMMTADKDDPRFDSFYLDGNELRYFVGLFLADMPSYMALGFECRDPHPTPAPNEHYTKLFVFQVSEGPKKTIGQYIWGKNRQLYWQIVRMKKLAGEIFSEIENQKTAWLMPPEPTGLKKVLAWTQTDDPKFVFLANFDTKNDWHQIDLPLPKTWENEEVEIFFSTARETSGAVPVEKTGHFLRIENVWAGECLIVRKILPKTEA